MEYKHQITTMIIGNTNLQILFLDFMDSNSILDKAMFKLLSKLKMSAKYIRENHFHSLFLTSSRNSTKLVNSWPLENQKSRG